MALPDISLAQFNRIASGSYNAGQVDFKTKANGATELVKVNNHVWRTSKNNVELSPERVLEVKNAFLNALQKGGVSADAMKEIRWQLGLSAELDVSSNGKDSADLKVRYTPLTRAQVREILDKYANEGKGFTDASRAGISYDEWQAGQATARMGGKHAAKRDAVNQAAVAALEGRANSGVGNAVKDMLSLLSLRTPLSGISGEMSARFTGANAANERNAQRAMLSNSFRNLAMEAVKLLPANVRESQTFSFLGQAARLVKGDDGKLAAIVTDGHAETKVDLKIGAEELVVRVIGRTVADRDVVGSDAKNIFESVFNHNLECGLVASDRTSLTRQFAAHVIAERSNGKISPDDILNGDYNTGILAQIAEQALDGADVGDSKKALDDYHEKLRSENADLPQEIKDMLELVADIPLEKPDGSDGEFIVSRPIVGDIDKVVQKMPAPVQAPVPKSLDEIGGLNGVKDFVADLVFSDETMVGDVKIDKPGEAMRKMLSSGRNAVALAEIIRNPDIIDRTCSSEISSVVKDGLGKMIAILDESFKAANNGKTLSEAAKEDGFAAKLSDFLKDGAKLPGAELARFDNIIRLMSSKGCENIQKFINSVFKVDGGSVNAQGGIVKNPYKDMTVDQIEKELDGKTLNQILDTASNSDSPGQVGFFRQVVSTYFTSLGNADKRSCFAAAMRYAGTFDFGRLEGEELKSAQKAAINKFTGAILKGTSPLLQKMMQGLPRDIMGEYADALADMKSALAPIPRKIVQAHFMKMINDSDGKIQSIELKQSLGAASVGEAFLCTFKYTEKGETVEKDFVVKIMRHDAEKRVKAEAEIFTAAAKTIPGMDKTWEGQLEQYMKEFNFINEADNVNEGARLYDIAGNEGHKLRGIGPNVASMKMSTIVQPQKNVMVAEVAQGHTVDSFFKQQIADVRDAASAVFKQDPTTGRIQWQDGPADPETGKPTKVPAFKDNIPATAITNLQLWLTTRYSSLQKASTGILQAAKVWFHEAILGSGKFHGDTHAGNLMVFGSKITFIDFGNLYKLDGSRPDGVNEKTELLRVITGAAFRNSEFMLDGLEKLMSAEGRGALADANIRDKAKAILGKVLDKSKGGFAFNIVYRLQAAVSELQKLGLELPPQINCFIQSLVRLSNTVTEMNTIMNQCKTMLDSANKMTCPAPERDELDLVGQQFDIFASEEGKQLVNGRPKYELEAVSARFGGINAGMAKMFTKDGEYTLKVADRLAHATDPVAEAEKLYNVLTTHGDREHSVQAESILGSLDKHIAKFRTDYAAAATSEAKSAAIKAFALDFAKCEADMLQAMKSVYQLLPSFKLKNPNTFASALTDVLIDGFDALKGSLSAGDALQLGKDASNIAYNELELNYWLSFMPSEVIKKLEENATKLGDDKGYQVDIGV